MWRAVCAGGLSLGALGVALGLAGCTGAPAQPTASGPRDATRDDETRLARMYAELQDDIFTAYDRDEPPELVSSAIDPRLGVARIGAGPGDVYISVLSAAGDRTAALSRWPLDVRSTHTDAKSKHLEIQISVDQTAAWMADEVSWRIEMCDGGAANPQRITAVVPLRVTGLYARDGDRWVSLVEHLSFASPPLPLPAAASRPIQSAAVAPRLGDPLRDVLTRGLYRVGHDPAAVAQDRGALVLGPVVADEWHGPRVLEARLPEGALEDPRIGLVGSPATATVAYWIGDYLARVPARPGVAAGEARMRATHVFEKRWFDAPGGQPGDRSCRLDDRDIREATERAKLVAAHCQWVLVQSHLSQPITDDALTGLVFGTALISAAPLRFECPDGSRPSGPTAPGAGLRPAPTPPVARTP